jgi:polysaccharide pyruvyl transferase WcaK-like protein
MKIGILTFHHVDNYGATLQAYALFTFLKQQKYDVEIIDYRPYKAIIKYFLREYIPIHYNSTDSSFSIKYKVFKNIIRAWRIRKFLLYKVELSQRKSYFRRSLKYFYNKYDVVICGSDQIWNYESMRGFDTSYFLDFVSNETTRKISYAASFGNPNSLKEHRNKVSTLVQDFQKVLVRDSNSQRIIKTECNKDAVKVLDPTFLVQYSDLISSPRITDKYLLIYNQLELNTAELNFVKLIAKKMNLITVAVGKYNKFAENNIVDASPQEWISLFYHASYIVTNTYHGTLFSIIFKKPFTSFVIQNKKNKMADILSSLNLDNRIFIDKPEAINQQLCDIDYEIISKTISSKVTESKKYLLDAIEQRVLEDKK